MIADGLEPFVPPAGLGSEDGDRRPFRANAELRISRWWRDAHSRWPGSQGVSNFVDAGRIEAIQKVERQAAGMRAFAGGIRSADESAEDHRVPGPVRSRRQRQHLPIVTNLNF